MLSRTLRFYYLKLVRQEGTPEKISAGMALGVFIGLITPPGPQMIIAGILATLVHFNRITAIMGVWITNPLTIPFIYPIQVYIGCMVLNIDLALPDFHNVMEFWNVLLNASTNMDIVLALLTGATISAIILAVASYYITFYLVVYYRKQKLKRRIRQARQQTS